MSEEEEGELRRVQKVAQNPATGCWVRLYTTATQGPLLFLPPNLVHHQTQRVGSASLALQSISPTSPQTTPQLDVLVAPLFIPSRAPGKLGPGLGGAGDGYGGPAIDGHFTLVVLTIGQHLLDVGQLGGGAAGV